MFPASKDASSISRTKTETRGAKHRELGNPAPHGHRSGHKSGSYVYSIDDNNVVYLGNIAARRKRRAKCFPLRKTQVQSLGRKRKLEFLQFIVNRSTALPIMIHSDNDRGGVTVIGGEKGGTTHVTSLGTLPVRVSDGMRRPGNGW